MGELVKASDYASAEFLAEMTEGNRLPRIKMLWGSSPETQDEELADRGAKVGHFWLSQVDTGLTKCFKATPMLARPHALCMKGDEVHIESFDPKSVEFAQVKKMKLNPPGPFPEWYSRWGGDILFWLPDHNCFAVYFMYGCAMRTFAATYNYTLANNRKNLIVKAKRIDRPGKAVLFAPELLVTDESFPPPMEELWEAAQEQFNDTTPRLAVEAEQDEVPS